MNVKKQFFDGLINQNPSLVQLLGMCPLLAITTSMFNGLGMGLAVTIILTCSNVVISALRKIIQLRDAVLTACHRGSLLSGKTGYQYRFITPR